MCDHQRQFGICSQCCAVLITALADHFNTHMMKHLYETMLDETKKKLLSNLPLNPNVTFGSVGQLFLTGKTQSENIDRYLFGTVGKFLSVSKKLNR